MVLIVFLLAYLVRRKLDGSGSFSSDALWRAWFHRGSRVHAGAETSVGGGLALVLLPAFLSGLLEYLLVGYGVRWLVYPVEFVVLVAMMGAPGWKRVLRAYSDAWSRDDMQAAWHHVRDWLPLEDRRDDSSAQSMHLSLAQAFIRSVFERYFLVAFWFVVGGMPAAILARGLVALAEQWPQAAARPRFIRWAEWLAWVPARLVSVTFGIAGDLAGWLSQAKGLLLAFGKPAGDLLAESANSALTGYALDPEKFLKVHPDEWSRFGSTSLGAVRDLLNRSMLAWLCALALLVISGVV
ncbi:MAG: histidine kinase [Marinobacter sp.]|nr:histidine kinase [Marinobacter sp.]